MTSGSKDKCPLCTLAVVIVMVIVIVYTIPISTFGSISAVTQNTSAADPAINKPETETATPPPTLLPPSQTPESLSFGIQVDALWGNDMAVPKAFGIFANQFVAQEVISLPNLFGTWQNVTINAFRATEPIGLTIIAIPMAVTLQDPNGTSPEKIDAVASLLAWKDSGEKVDVSVQLDNTILSQFGEQTRLIDVHDGIDVKLLENCVHLYSEVDGRKDIRLIKLFVYICLPEATPSGNQQG